MASSTNSTIVRVFDAGGAVGAGAADSDGVGSAGVESADGESVVESTTGSSDGSFVVGSSDIATSPRDELRYRLIERAVSRRRILPWRRRNGRAPLCRKPAR